jgi:hypothetical protein
MRNIKASKLVKMYVDNGESHIVITSDGSEFRFNIDSGESVQPLPTVDSKPSLLELKLRKIDYCSEDGEKYKMYVLGTQAWKEG